MEYILFLGKKVYSITPVLMVRYFHTMGTSLCSRCMGHSKWPFQIVKHLSQNILATGIWLQANMCLNNIGKQLWAPQTPSKSLICHSAYLRDHRWFKHHEMGVVVKIKLLGVLDSVVKPLYGRAGALECGRWSSGVSWWQLPWPFSYTKPPEASRPFRQSLQQQRVSEETQVLSENVSCRQALTGGRVSYSGIFVRTLMSRQRKDSPIELTLKRFSPEELWWSLVFFLWSRRIEMDFM